VLFLFLKIRLQAKWVSMLLARGRHPQQNREIIPMEVVEHAATGSSIAAGTASFPEIVKSYCILHCSIFLISFHIARALSYMARASMCTPIEATL
jgi:hypothetical protein